MAISANLRRVVSFAGSFFCHLSRKFLRVLCDGVDGQLYCFYGKMRLAGHGLNLRFYEQLSDHGGYATRENGGRLYENDASAPNVCFGTRCCSEHRRLSRLKTGFAGNFAKPAPCALLSLRSAHAADAASFRKVPHSCQSSRYYLSARNESRFRQNHLAESTPFDRSPRGTPSGRRPRPPSPRGLLIAIWAV